MEISFPFSFFQFTPPSHVIKFCMKRRPYSPFMSYLIMHNITPKLLWNRTRIQMSNVIYKILIKNISYENIHEKM